MNIFGTLYVYNYLSTNIGALLKQFTMQLLLRFSFIDKYYNLTELLWQEGLMVDFLQKKIVDNWVKKFLIQSSYLFNERLIFDKIIRFYLDLIIWPAHRFFIFEFNNVSGTFFITVFALVVIVFFLFFVYLFLLIL